MTSERGYIQKEKMSSIRVFRDFAFDRMESEGHRKSHTRYPDAIFKMFSYHGDDGHGNPKDYQCEDTFTNSTQTEVQHLKAQLTNLMNARAFPNSEEQTLSS